ncbi:MAG: cytochrome c nitrite reductase small subunit [Chrysiogenales bacterium]|nr:MAG: cytochrome c nitrite reductase small subunit [Chrysiogenales bacterium]
MLSTLKKYIRRLWSHLVLPPAWQLPFLVLAGLGLGLGLLAIYLSNAWSYASDDPKACINCHVMTTHYGTWEKSSHAHVATCNDCHVPHDNVIKKYVFKATDGLRHSAMFTFHLEPQVLEIKPAGMRAVHDNCLRCHTKTVDQVASLMPAQCQPERVCWECHRETPHGRQHSLSALPNAQVPKLAAPLPNWISEQFPEMRHQKKKKE